jgi:hypothetical protein
MIILRGIFRTIELSEVRRPAPRERARTETWQGWNGRLFVLALASHRRKLTYAPRYTHEVYLLALDAAPMVVCMLALCASHPSWSLPTAKRGSEGIDDRTPPNEGVIDYKERDMAERTV